VYDFKDYTNFKDNMLTKSKILTKNSLLGKFSRTPFILKTLGSFLITVCLILKISNGDGRVEKKLDHVLELIEKQKSYLPQRSLFNK